MTFVLIGCSAPILISPFIYLSFWFCLRPSLESPIACLFALFKPHLSTGSCLVTRTLSCPDTWLVPFGDMVCLVLYSALSALCGSGHLGATSFGSPTLSSPILLTLYTLPSGINIQKHGISFHC